MAARDSLELADRLHSAAIRLLRGVRMVDAETGVSAPRLSALSVLVFGGPTSLSALARAEQVTAPTMSRLIAELEGDGLVAKRVDPADRRGVRIEATAKGRKLMQEGRRRRLALLARRLDRLSRAEQAVLDQAAALIARLGADQQN